MIKINNLDFSFPLDARSRELVAVAARGRVLYPAVNAEMMII